MRCFNCGNEIADGAGFCPNCGTQVVNNNQQYDYNQSMNANVQYNDPNMVNMNQQMHANVQYNNPNMVNMNQQMPQQPGAPVVPENAKNSAATISLIIGIVGIIVAAVICGPLAISAGIKGINNAKLLNGKGKGLAIAGLILGCIDLTFGILNIVLSILV